MNSTCKAFKANKQLGWPNRLLQNIKTGMDQPKLFDNQNAVRLAKTLSFTSKVSTRCETQFREGER